VTWGLFAQRMSQQACGVQRPVCSESSAAVEEWQEIARAGCRLHSPPKPRLEACSMTQMALRRRTAAV